ncbi:MAG: hypothetical protein ABJP45_14360 [Cyclobacteriaceae bacterium]
MKENMINAIALNVILISAGCMSSTDALGQFPTPDGLEVVGQDASPEDMRMFDSFIGTWKGKSFKSRDDRNLHFLIEYEWFDRTKTICGLKIIQVNEDDGNTIQTMQGYYGFDPRQKRIFHYIFSATGGTGFGTLLEFDAKNGSRANAMVARMNQASDLQQMRDRFRLIDEESFENKAYVWQPDSKEWKMMNQGIYKKIK